MTIVSRDRDRAGEDEDVAGRDVGEADGGGGPVIVQIG
jgi:hypothetical protein